MVETIFSCVVAVICMFPVFIFGIVQYHSKKPVVFWAGKEPPTAEQLTDLKAYNHRHGIMWMVYSAAFVLCFFIGLVMDGPPWIWRRDCRRYRMSRRSAGFNLVS